MSTWSRWVECFETVDFDSVIDARDLDSPRAGLVRQRLCFAFQLETTDYYRLVAVLMAQVRTRCLPQLSPEKVRPFITCKQTNDNPSGTGARECAPLTLRRLYVWMQDPIGACLALGCTQPRPTNENMRVLRAAANHAVSGRGD